MTPRYLYFIPILCIILCTESNAQQQRLYTMFMYNKMAMNPGYAGYHQDGALTGIYRSQWIGLEGAPESQILSYHTAFGGERIGFGLSLARETIGISSQTTFDGVYAYKLPIGPGTLSLGAQASVRNMMVDYTDPSVQAIEDLTFDQGVDLARDSRWVANFGAGAYFHTDRFYAGIAAPRMMNSDIDFEENNLFISREERHWYLMTGVVLPLNYSLDLVPQVLVRYTEVAPVDVDLNATIIWKEDFGFGMTYRAGGDKDNLGESIDLIASAIVARGLLLALSYDITLSDLREYSNGSVEVALRYVFKAPARQGKFVNPRYF